MLLMVPTIFSHAFADLISCSADIEVCSGTSKADVMMGNQLPNSMNGFNGTDTLLGLAGDDNITGAERYDVLIGQEGDDRLRWRAGKR